MSAFPKEIKTQSEYSSVQTQIGSPGQAVCPPGVEKIHIEKKKLNDEEFLKYSYKLRQQFLTWGLQVPWN